MYVFSFIVVLHVGSLIYHHYHQEAEVSLRTTGATLFFIITLPQPPATPDNYLSLQCSINRFIQYVTFGIGFCHLPYSLVIHQSR